MPDDTSFEWNGLNLPIFQLDADVQPLTVEPSDDDYV
jgi:hypothetical protein